MNLPTGQVNARWHKIKIRSTNSAASHRENTEILLDGKPLLGVEAIKYELRAENNLALVTIEMQSGIEIEGGMKISRQEKCTIVNGAGEIVGEIFV